MSEQMNGATPEEMDEMSTRFVTLTDDDGNEIEFEHIDTIEDGGNIYLAFIPAKLELEDEAEVVILKVVMENGEEILASVEDDAEADRIFEMVIANAEADEE